MKVIYKNFHFDNVLILSTIAKITFENDESFSEDEQLIIHAIKRANYSYSDLSTAEIGKELSNFDENQMLGFANNVKGILHELQFIEIENADGDSITASIFADTNHASTDVMLTDASTGEIVEIQLKATDSSSYVNDWIQEHPNGEILITEELAEKMNLETSGITNEELTTDVDNFVDRIIESSDDDEFWEYFPYLTTISIAIAGSNLFFRYKRNEIPFNLFKRKFIKLTGIKITKFALISCLMMIPGINVIVGATVLFLTLNSFGHITKKIIG